MKQLTYNGKTYQADRLVKTETDILGYVKNEKVFSFLGINDFSQFYLGDGQEYDFESPTLEQQQIAQLLLITAQQAQQIAAIQGASTNG